MKYDIDILRQQLDNFLNGNESALDMHKYLISIPLEETTFPPEVKEKISKFIHFKKEDDDSKKKGETIALNKNVLRLVSSPYDDEKQKYVSFDSFDYDIAFVNTCRLLRINGIAYKEKLIELTAVELAKKWKGTKTSFGLLDNANTIIALAETLANDVWTEHNKDKKSKRYHDAATPDGKNIHALKFKYDKETIKRIKKGWKEDLNNDSTDIKIMRWLDSQIVKIIVDYSIEKWRDLTREKIIENIKETFGLKISERTLLKHGKNKIKDKNEDRIENIKKLMNDYGKKWKKHADEKDITWYKRHRKLFQNE